jgi:hypothetical protein
MQQEMVTVRLSGIAASRIGQACPDRHGSCHVCPVSANLETMRRRMMNAPAGSGLPKFACSAGESAQSAGIPEQHCVSQIWPAFCYAHWTAQRSAPMQLDLLIVWAAILGGLTFLALVTD